MYRPEKCLPEFWGYGVMWLSLWYATYHCYVTDLWLHGNKPKEKAYLAGFPGYRLRGDLRLARMVLSYDVHP